MSRIREPLVSASFRAAPSAVTTPAWVTFSGISPEARCLVEPLIYWSTKSLGRPAELNREFLAWHLLKSRYDKGVQGPLEELQAIGFLEIFDGGVRRTKRSGRLIRHKRRDPLTGRPVPDTFVLAFDPPPSYVGPRNLDEAYQWFQDDQAEARERHEAKYADRPKQTRPRTFTIPRTRFGRLDDAQVIAAPRPGGAAAPLGRGAAENPQVIAAPSPQGAAVPPSLGTAASPQVNAASPPGGTSDRQRREGTPPAGEFPPSIDRRRAAGPGPATPTPATPEALQLVSKLAWPAGERPARGKATQLACQVDYALHQRGWRPGDLLEHLNAKMRKATRSPVGYLEGALHPDELPDPRPSDPAEEPPTSPAARVPDWCGRCGPGYGDTPRFAPRLRVLEEEDPKTGLPRLCPCHPDHPTATAPEHHRNDDHPPKPFPNETITEDWQADAPAMAAVAVAVGR